MLKQTLTRLQSVLPQHLLSKWMGKLSTSSTPWLKDLLIRYFIHHYPINMQLALEENPEAYATFDDFFTRRLKPALRPIAAAENAIASPVDGTLAQIGHITQNQLLQAKQFYFSLDTLFAHHQEFAQRFYDGSYITLYLAPYDYHRVHMPIAGQLTQSLYVPGRLFSVNRMTSELIPNLYSRNERFISLFDTTAGSMAVILVGAMMVGNIQMSWMHQPVRAPQAYSENHANGLSFAKGAELGYFHMGSTVILLFQKNAVEWADSLKEAATVQFGQNIGILKS